MLNLKKYKSLIFDCDGVILNSNKIKTNCFRKIFENYSKEATDEFIIYHESNGGISRYIKIRYFLEQILPKYSDKSFLEDFETLLKLYGVHCTNALRDAQVAERINELRLHTKKQKWFVVSGSDQGELRGIFKYKNIDTFFDGGIFGSPDIKTQILKREIKNKSIMLPGLFFGDSWLDHVAAKENKLDFLFVKKWTDFKNYKHYCQKHSLKIINSIGEIIL